MENFIEQGESIFMAIDGGKQMYTIEDILALPEGERAELIDGEMFMMASPTTTHQEILSWIHAEIFHYIKNKKGKCKVVPAPFAVFFKNDDKNYVEPDIAVICNRDKLDDQGCHGAPDWIIEIVSPSSKTMDYCRKLTAYEAAGVREYWIVDSMREAVILYDLEHGEAPHWYTFADTVKSSIFGELALDFRELKKYLAE